MEDRDYRSEVGKKIEEALKVGDFDLIEDLIEVPPMETFMQWAEKGEEKRKKRILRKRILVSCIAVVVVSASVLIGLKCFALPEVTADPEDDVTIDMTDMESIETYSSWDALPDEVKEQFIEVKDLPEGYVVEKIEVAEGTFGRKVTNYISIKNKTKTIEVRQCLYTEGVLSATIFTDGNEKFTLGNIEVFVEEKDGIEVVSYKYIMENIIVDIVVPADIDVESVEKLIDTVQY